MNDFTRDELIEMWEYCNWGPDGVGHSDFRLSLWRKIEAMIDNYCQHEEIQYYGEVAAAECKSCHMVIL